MAENWSLYHPELPEPLRRLADTPPMQRLRQVGMNCGCEYTAFPRFAGWAPYSRFDHSVGVGLIVWHFTGDLRQSAAGLLHDVATPVFAHTVDFLNGDHLRQESTEARTAEVIAASPELRALLAEYGLAPEEMAYLGDDWIDLDPMRSVGMPMAVANAVRQVKKEALYITAARGGEGAVREAVEFLLAARMDGKNPADLWTAATGPAKV